MCLVLYCESMDQSLISHGCTSNHTPLHRTIRQPVTGNCVSTRVSIMTTLHHIDVFLTTQQIIENQKESVILNLTELKQQFCEGFS